MGVQKVPESFGTKETNGLIFWTVCIPLRCFLLAIIILAHVYRCREVELATTVYTTYAALGLFKNFVTYVFRTQISNLLKSWYGEESAAKFSESVQYGNFGGPVWWNTSRFVHSFSLMTYSVLTWCDVDYAYIAAIVDVAWAVSVGVVHFLIGPVSIVFVK